MVRIMEKEEILRIFSENLRAERARKKLTQEQLAEMAGISQKYLYRIENAKMNPTIAVVCRLALALGVTLDRLLPLKTAN